jgi:Peptidase family M1 domain
LVAVAVGPFELVDAGVVGRGKTPLRIAALAGGRDRVAVVARRLPRIVDELERYVDDALPWPKLDLVVVPRLFGAMENPGLVTFASRLIAGDARSSAFADEFSRVAAHELAHFWFGDLVTHAWWNDLWLAEAFASWLGDRTALALGIGTSLDAALARRRALEADAQAGALPLRRTVATNADPDDSFDDTEYDKGQSVLATFERWVGEAPFRAAVQAYLHAHRGGVATAEDFTRALEGVAGANIARAFAAYVEHAGVPIVDVALECAGSPKLVASARAGVTIPMCMRVPDADAPICALVGARAELPLASCPAWVQPTGGYYVVSWRGTRPADPPFSALSLGQRVALGEDLELAVRRGELPPRDALGELRALAGPELGGAVAAAAIARAIDPLVGEGERVLWQQWLAARFAPRLELKALSEPGELAGDLDDDLIALIGAEQLPAAVRASAKQRAMRDLARNITPVASVVAAAGGDRAMFDRIAALATRDPSWTAEPLGAFGPAVAPAAVELALGALPSSATMPAITAYFRRPATRAAIWAAVRARLPELLAHVTPPDASDLLDATRSLCDASSRAELVAAFEPNATRIPEGHEHLARALVAIDACIAARAKAGELGAALQPSAP